MVGGCAGLCVGGGAFRLTSASLVSSPEELDAVASAIFGMERSGTVRENSALL